MHRQYNFDSMSRPTSSQKSCSSNKDRSEFNQFNALINSVTNIDQSDSQTSIFLINTHCSAVTDHFINNTNTLDHLLNQESKKNDESMNGRSINIDKRSNSLKVNDLDSYLKESSASKDSQLDVSSTLLTLTQKQQGIEDDNDPIIKQLFAHRNEMTDIDPESELIRRRRMHNLMRYSKKYTKLQVEQANKDWIHGNENDSIAKFNVNTITNANINDCQYQSENQVVIDYHGLNMNEMDLANSERHIACDSKCQVSNLDAESCASPALKNRKKAYSLPANSHVMFKDINNSNLISRKSALKKTYGEKLGVLFSLDDLGLYQSHKLHQKEGIEVESLIMLPEYSSTSNQEFDSACRVVKYNENNECSSKLPSLQDDRVKTVTFQCDSLTLSEAKHEQEYEDMSLHCKCKGIAKSCGIKSNRSKVVDFYKRMKAYYKPTKYPLIPSSDYMNASMNTCSEIHGIGINVESDIKPDSNYQGSIDYAPVLLRETSYRPNLSDCYMKLGLFQDHHKTIVQRVPKQQQSSIQSQSSDRNAQTVNGMNHDGTKKSMMKCGNEFFRIPGNKKSIGKKICQLFAH